MATFKDYMRIENITSAQNPKIKDLLALQEKSKLRRERGLFVVEGRRELLHCLEVGYKAKCLFVCEDIIGKRDLSEILDAAGDCMVYNVPSHIYAKIAYRGGTEGVVAELESKTLSLKDIKFKSEKPLIVVMESVEKPGNLGAILRSADASGVDAVIICDPLTDLYNPNLIRASIGAIFTVSVVTTSSEEAIDWLRKNNITIYTAQLQDSSWYYDCDMTEGTAIVLGTEATGLSLQWRLAANKHIKIPMLGKLDSLNVSVSAAILLFEAVRQRKSL